jgi:hypothetical protein
MHYTDPTTNSCSWRYGRTVLAVPDVLSSVMPQLVQSGSRRHAQLTVLLRHELVVDPLDREELQQCCCCAVGQTQPAAALLQGGHSLRLLQHCDVRGVQQDLQLKGGCIGSTTLVDFEQTCSRYVY